MIRRLAHNWFPLLAVLAVGACVLGIGRAVAPTRKPWQTREVLGQYVTPSEERYVTNMMRIMCEIMESNAAAVPKP